MLKPIKHYDKQIYQIIIKIQYNTFLLTNVSLLPQPDSSQDVEQPPASLTYDGGSNQVRRRKNPKLIKRPALKRLLLKAFLRR